MSCDHMDPKQGTAYAVLKQGAAYAVSSPYRREGKI